MSLGDKRFCPFAVKRPVKGIRLRRFSPFGICVHQTGRGIVEKAHAKKADTVEIAIKYYRSGWIAHYLIGYDGSIFQFMPDTFVGAHIGVSKEEREKYLSGEWVKDFEQHQVRRWEKRWPGYHSPQHLHPARSANAAYIGVELLPLRLIPKSGFWFTDDQHQAVIDLCKDRAAAHGFPQGWQYSPRLVGHEDVDAYGRWGKDGGWDPGGLRDEPYFDWERVWDGISSK